MRAMSSARIAAQSVFQPSARYFSARSHAFDAVGARLRHSCKMLKRLCQARFAALRPYGLPAPPMPLFDIRRGGRPFFRRCIGEREKRLPQLLLVMRDDAGIGLGAFEYALL